MGQVVARLPRQRQGLLEGAVEKGDDGSGQAGSLAPEAGPERKATTGTADRPPGGRRSASLAQAGLIIPWFRRLWRGGQGNYSLFAQPGPTLESPPSQIGRASCREKVCQYV